MNSPVPNFTKSLRDLAAILAKAEAHCDEHRIDPNAILAARLYPDMFHLTRNVMIACDTAKGVAARLSRTDNPVHEDDETTFSELRARIAKTIDFMESVPDDAFDGAEAREVTMKFGPNEVKYTGAAYLADFAIPNFYFHMTAAYCILRHNGVPIGKRDFLGMS